MTKAETYARYAKQAYRASDSGRWVAAFWAAKIVGNYERDATISLASSMGISPDAVEDLAHAYMMYAELRSEPEFRSIARRCRRWPVVYMSHFRSLYDAWKRYNLEIHEVASILVDVVQANGKLSSRDVDEHTRSKYGKERDWRYYAQRTNKMLLSLRMCPDLPSPIRVKADELFSLIGEADG